MNLSWIISALAIPNEALVDQRVPKKLLLEQGAPTAADKRQIQDGIEEITWVAALKPTNVGVPAFQDAVREYLEIAILTVAMRSTAKQPRLIELIHRAIPYPVVLVSEHRNAITLSLAHKRRSQGEMGKVVIEDIRQVALTPDILSSEESAFIASLAVSRLPARDLFALYDGLLERLAALEAARITGMFVPPDSVDRAAVIRVGLDAHSRLQREISTLRTAAAKEKQLNRRVKLNLVIKKLEAELAEAVKTLKS